MVNSGTAGRTLTPSSYHQSSPAMAAGAGGKAAGPMPSKHSRKEGGGKRAVSSPSTAMVPPAKKTKLSSNGKNKGNVASTVMAAGNVSGGMARGMYLAFVDNAIAEKKQGRNQPYNELLGQFRNLTNAIPSSESTAGSSNAPSASTLKAWMEALTHVVAQLDRSHSTLVDAILSLPWTSMDDSFVYAYSRFVQALLCSRSEFVGVALEKIVKAFRFQSTSTYTENGQEADQTTRREAYNRLHHLLSSLIHLIPTLPTTLWPIVNRYFPHKRESRNSQVVYISNALKIVEYCPQLGESVLGAVILRAMSIDVEIQIDVEDLEDDEGTMDEEVFGYNGENPFNSLVGDEDESEDDSDDEGPAVALDDISSDEGGSDDDEDGEDGRRPKPEEEEKVTPPKVIKRLKEMAAKLDAILKVIFEFLKRIVSASSQQKLSSHSSLPSPSSPSSLESTPSKNGSVVPGVEDSTTLSHHAGLLLRRTIFDVLLHIFDDKMLKTFQTRHTQFIIFWYTALSPEFTDDFMGILMGRTMDLQGTPTITRVASAGYLASFVSRSMIIDRNASRRVMALLLRYLEEDMEELRETHAVLAQQSGGRVKSLSSSEAEKLVKNSVVFYAICQAAFYIFCFRWKDLLDSTGDDEEEELLELEGVPHSTGRRWMPEMESLKLAVSSGLNPLKFCSPNVVSQFARIAHKTDFMYCHSIIESNKRQSAARDSARSSNSSSRVGSPPSSEDSSDSSDDDSDLGPLRPKLPTAVTGPRSPVQSSVADEAYLVSSTLKEAQIDSHFPFDPFKLPLSKEYMNGIYREWDSGGLDEDSDEDSDDEGEIELSLVATGLNGGKDDENETADESVQSSTMTDKSYLMPPSGRVNGGIAGSMTSSEGDEADFSKSFDAMSVSPRRSGFAGLTSL